MLGLSGLIYGFGTEASVAKIASMKFPDSDLSQNIFKEVLRNYVAGGTKAHSD